MTIQWLARIALALYLVYSTAFYAEGLRPRGSVGLRYFGGLTELAMVSALAWVGWPA